MSPSASISWAALCPKNDESAGKRPSTRMRKGAPWLKTALVQFAWAAARKKASYFQAQFHRLRARRGANATVVCGHTVGEYAFIAAGAVVARDVPAFALMAGVSARRIGWVSHAGERLGPDLVCPRSGRRCRESGHDRIEEIV